MRTEQVIRLSKPQTRVHRTLKPHTSNCIPWGRGLGKSWYIRLCWYLLIAQWDGQMRPGAKYTGVRIVLLMPTLRQAKKVHAALMIAELTGAFSDDPSNDWSHLGAKIDRTEWRITFPGGSWIQWMSAEGAKGIRGMRCDFVCIDECDDIDTETVDAIVGPWLSEPHSLGMRLLAGTPTRGRYGLLWRSHQRGLAGTRGCYSYHASFRDAPELFNLEFIEGERQNISPELFSREWECNFDAAEGLVYGLFREAFHVREVDPRTRWSEIIVGVDHGYEDPGVFLPIGVAGNGWDATCWILGEVYRQHQTDAFWVPEARRLHIELCRLAPKVRWYADPSRPDRIQAIKNAGVPIVGADNAIEDGVNAVADRLVVRRRGETEKCSACGGSGCAVCARDSRVNARLYVASNETVPGLRTAKETRGEFGKYRRKRDPKNRERVLDDIEDKNNHSMDAARYPILSRFGHVPQIYRSDTLPTA